MLACEKAYAKINHYLYLTGTRADGYHDLDTVMQTITLHDTIMLDVATVSPAQAAALVSVALPLPEGRHNGKAGTESIPLQILSQNEVSGYLPWVGLDLSFVPDPEAAPAPAGQACRPAAPYLSLAAADCRKNLIFKAFSQYLQRFGCPTGLSEALWQVRQAAPGALPLIRLFIIKRIPARAGLGGGSADAAAVLRMLLNLETNAKQPDRNAVLALAGDLGADVPFCLAGGLRRCTGIGDIMHELPLPSPQPCLLLKPQTDSETAVAFARFDHLVSPAERRRINERHVIRTAEAWSDRKGNDFAFLQSADWPWLQQAQLLLETLYPGSRTDLTGSGSCMYCLPVDQPVCGPRRLHSPALPETIREQTWWLWKGYTYCQTLY